MNILTDKIDFAEFSFTQLCETDFEFNTFFEIIFCKKGKVNIEFINGTISAYEGEAVLIFPFVIHRFKGEDFCAEKMVFCKKTLNTFFANKYFDTSISNLEKLPYRKINYTFSNDIEKMLENEKFFVAAELLYIFNEQTGIAEIKKRESSLFLDMTDYIDKNLQKHISTSDLAKKFGLTTSHIGYIFKNEIGMSPVTYITNVKMAQAAKMLTDTKKSIKHICNDCGFNSAIYFNNLFKDAFGITPKRYQERFCVW